LICVSYGGRRARRLGHTLAVGSDTILKVLAYGMSLLLYVVSHSHVLDVGYMLRYQGVSHRPDDEVAQDLEVEAVQDVKVDMSDKTY
jgi:hypothetical protein